MYFWGCTNHGRHTRTLPPATTSTEHSPSSGIVVPKLTTARCLFAKRPVAPRPLVMRSRLSPRRLQPLLSVVVKSSLRLERG